MKNLFVALIISCISLRANAIVNGYTVRVNDFKSFVSIRAKSFFPGHTGKEINACGGVLIAPSWVLTAASCWPTFSDAYRKDVFVGVSVRTNGDFFKRIKIKSFHFAPLKVDGERIDAALLNLESEAIYFGAEVAILEDSPVSDLTPTTTVGLGMGLMGSPLTAYQSRVADSDLCRSGSNSFDPDSDICVGERLAGPRIERGDTGGPIYRRDGASMMLIGIIKGGVHRESFVPYTAVAELSSWISEVINW